MVLDNYLKFFLFFLKKVLQFVKICVTIFVVNRREGYKAVWFIYINCKIYSYAVIYLNLFCLKKV